ncbi:MAG TPA: adenosylhomocysteinase [Mycobacteriales bacterium]|nr:adenosylhomocysteinase [Mycobacteriales bacterium]
MSDYDVSDLTLAEQGITRIEWADRAMPVLRQIRDRFAVQRPLAGTRVAACMHITTETANLMRTLVVGGADVHLCASNPLSTQDDAAAAMVCEYGVHVHARKGVDLTGYYVHINAVLDSEPEFVLDDGCDLVNTLHAARTELLDGIRAGCEETTTGVVRLRAMARAGALRFPVVAVNDTATKRMFDNRYGTGQSTVDAICRATHSLLAGKTVVVVGYGFCGKGVSERLRGMGADVVVCEVEPLRALDATMEGFRVLPMAVAATLGEFFVTVTGNKDVLRAEHFAVMRDGAILANSGHFDVEIDVRWLERNAVGKRKNVRPSLDEYLLADGRRVMLLAEGRLANLSIAEGHPAGVMDLSFADQALTLEWLCKEHENLEPGVHDVPATIDREVARLKLASMGIEIDTLTPAQQAYLDSWEFGS